MVLAAISAAYAGLTTLALSWRIVCQVKMRAIPLMLMVVSANAARALALSTHYGVDGSSNYSVVPGGWYPHDDNNIICYGSAAKPTLKLAPVCTGLTGSYSPTVDHRKWPTALFADATSQVRRSRPFPGGRGDSVRKPRSFQINEAPRSGFRRCGGTRRR